MLNTPTPLEVKDSIAGKPGNKQLYFTSCGVGKVAIHLMKQGMKSRGEGRVRWKIFFVLFAKPSIGKLWEGAVKQ